MYTGLSNYGEKLPFLKDAEVTRMCQAYGFTFEEIPNMGLDSKYYVIRDGFVVAAVDSKTKANEMTSIMGNSLKYLPKYEYNETNQEMMSSFIKKIEVKTNKKVDSVVFDNNNESYEIIIDGEKLTIPYSDNDVLSEDLVIETINNSETNKVTYNANDVLNESNKDYLENYYSELYSKDNKKVEVILNEDGTYSLVIDEEEKVRFDKGTTLSEALYIANNTLNEGKAISAANSNERSSGFNTRTNNNYHVYIDDDAYLEIQRDYAKSKSDFSTCMSSYDTSMLTDKLLAEYNSLVGSNVNPQKRINKTTELLDNINTNIKYSLEAYHNIDRDLGILLNSVIEEVFNMNSYHEISKGEELLTYDEKESRVSNLIKELDKQLTDLKEEYKEKYGNGGSAFPKDLSDLLYGLVGGLGLESTNSLDVYTDDNYEDYEYAYKFKDESNIARINFDSIGNVLDFIKEHDVFTKMNSYSNDLSKESWEKSGMFDLYKEVVGSDYDSELSERLFLSNYLYGQKKTWNSEIKDYWTELDKECLSKFDKEAEFCLIGPGFEHDDGTDYVINSLKERMHNQLSKTVTFENNEGETVTYNVLELCEYYKQEKKELEDSILSMENTKYNYERYYELMPYEKDMEDKEFLKYLVRDWSLEEPVRSGDKNDLQYLSQKEISLYFMYKAKGETDRANLYLESMKDMIHQRQGYEEAAERILEMGGVDAFLKSGFDGLGDGLQGFFESLGNCINCDGIRSAKDYRTIFMVSLLNEDNIYNMDIPPAYREVLKRNYTVMSSVGQILIPSVSYFIPYVGPYVSKFLTATSVFGSSLKSAKVSGVSDSKAYLYGALNVCSTLVLNKLMSGIAGLNGTGHVPNTIKDFVLGMGKQAGRAVLGTSIDLGLRAWLLNEPVDFSKVPSQLFDAALNGAFVAAVMNGTTKLTLKLADGITITLSGDQYKNYMDFYKDTIKQFNSTAVGQRLTKIQNYCSDAWKIIKGLHSNNIVTKLAAENALTNSDPILDFSDNAENIIEGLGLEKYERLLFDPNSNEYYIFNCKTLGAMTVPGNWISNHDPGSIEALRAVYQDTTIPINESSYTDPSVLPSTYVDNIITAQGDNVDQQDIIIPVTDSDIDIATTSEDDEFLIAANSDTDITANGEGEFLIVADSIMNNDIVSAHTDDGETLTITINDEAVDLNRLLSSSNPEIKEAAASKLKDYLLENPWGYTYRKYIDKMSPQDKLSLINTSLKDTNKYRLLLSDIDISPSSELYQEYPDEVNKIYESYFEKIKSGEITRYYYDRNAPYVFQKFDPLYPLRMDFTETVSHAYFDYSYLSDYADEIVDYTIENNIPIDDDVYYTLLKENVQPGSESFYKILDAGNYDESFFNANEWRLMQDDEAVIKIAKNHPEFLKGKTIGLTGDTGKLINATKDIEGVKYKLITGRYNPYLEEWHDLLGDKLLINPTNNSWTYENSYTYEEYMEKERIIEAYASSLKDTTDINGNTKSLTPFEKYIGAYIITTKFSTYKEDEQTIDLTRSVYEFIDKTQDRPIVCAGYVSMLNELLERQQYTDGSIDVKHWGVSAKDKGEKKDYDTHDRSIIHIVDPTYGIDIVSISDPTWDKTSTGDYTIEDSQSRAYEYLLRDQDTLSHEPQENFEDPLKDMHIETDEDMILVAETVGLYDVNKDPSVLAQEIRDKFNQTYTDEDYILALCSLNRFVDKNAVMPEERKVGENGFTVEEYNRAALSAGFFDKMIIPNELYEKPVSEVINYYRTEYDFDEFTTTSALDKMLQNKMGDSKGLRYSYTEDGKIAQQVSYQMLTYDDAITLYNLPDEELESIEKELGIQSSRTKYITLKTFDPDTPLDDLIPTDVDISEIIEQQQKEDHDILMSLIEAYESDKKTPSFNVDEAIDELSKIAQDKGMTIVELGKQRGETDLELQTQADELAKEVQSKAQEEEGRVTSLVKKYVPEEFSNITFEELTSGVKEGKYTEYMTLVGLDNDIKDVDSLSRKIITDYGEHEGVSLDACASNIHDSLRYTYVIDEEHYVDNIRNTVNSLRERGYIVNVKNTWGNKAYQGVNTTVTDRNTGFTYEIQFHTLDSYNTKEFLTHDYYAIFRNDYTTQTEKDLANQIQMYYQSQVPVPGGIIGEDFN